MLNNNKPMCLESACTTGITDLFVDGEYCSYGDKTVDVGGAIERIKANDVFSLSGEKRIFFILKVKEHILDLSRHKYTSTGVSPHTLLSGSTMMAFSSSSETSTQEVKEDLIMLMTRSLDRTSSFFTWSPVTLVLPAMPYLQSTNTNYSL